MIFYFSGTGNTRWIVQQLAEATGEELRFIPDEMKKDVMRYNYVKEKTNFLATTEDRTGIHPESEVY